jgi:hypothetical protein
MPQPLNFPNLKQLLWLSPSQWRKIGIKAKSLITKDCLSGKLQGEPQVQQYKNQKYKENKASGMRRKTFNRKDDTRVKGSKLKKSGDRFTSGNDRLKGYKGTSLNTDISSVNMVLTQQTLNSLSVAAVDKDGVTMSYGAQFKDRILGNEKRGYNIRTLSAENQEIIKDEDIITAFEENVRRTIKDKLVINITLG